jgi:uncharacterized protein (TIGR02001 family)
MNLSLRFIVSLAVASAAFIAPRASAATTDFRDGTWTIAPAITSHYIFRGVELADTCFQPWLDYTAGPLSVGLWTSTALKDRASGGYDPEIDLYGSYSFPLAGGSLALVPGFYLYTYPDAKKSQGAYPATFEPSIATVFTVRGVQFTPKIYYDVMLRGATYEVTAAIAVPLKSLGTELDFNAVAGTYKWNDFTADATPALKNWGDYWSMGVAIPVQFTARSKLTLGVLYSEGRHNFYKQGTQPKTVNDAARAQTAFTLTYTLSL